jgi:uncharacterized protein (DUF1684 family)
MKYVIVVFLCLASFSCGQKKQPILGETEFQKRMNAEFKDASTSPLKSKDLKVFNGLDFFNFDSAYVVKAALKPTPNTEWFNMRTTTDRLSKERIYGVLSFELKGQTFELNVYQGEETLQKEEGSDYLFLPFIDDTNGSLTYGGGRYIDLKIPEGDSITVDFNTAYNPYCAYNEKYSCPIVPRENYIGLEVKAGLKVYRKD